MIRPRPQEVADKITSLIQKKKSEGPIVKYIQIVMDVTPGDLVKYLLKLRKEDRQLLRGKRPNAALKEILNLLDEDDPAEQPEQEQSAQDEPAIPCTRAEFSEFKRDVTDLIMQLSTRTTAAPIPDPQIHTITYTQDITRWEAAHKAGHFLQLLDTWVSSTLQVTSIGETNRQTLKLSLTTAARTIKHSYAMTDHEDAWRTVKPMVLHALAMEAASEAYLRGGLKLEFVSVAADMLAAEDSKLWTGSPASIHKGIDDIIKVISANFLIAPRSHQGGRPGPRHSRRPGANARSDNKRNQKPSPTAPRGPSTSQ